MNASQQMGNPADFDTQDEQSDRRTQREQRLAARRAARSENSWVGGAILIGLGVLFLFNNLTGFYLQNWWALFILLPALGALASAWSNYQKSGSLSSPARVNLISATILILVAAIFLFNLDWMILGPLLLILAGVGLAINALLPD